MQIITENTFFLINEDTCEWNWRNCHVTVALM